MKKLTRTISGVTPVAVMARPWGCPGECVYCPAFPQDYQEGFIKECYQALNGNGVANLEEALALNETAPHRCVGLCIETRPDFCGEEEVRRMLRFGATRVEMGVQALDDDIYRLIRRGHGVAQVAEATRLLLP